MLVALAAFVLVVGLVRNHATGELAALLALLLAAVATGRWLLTDFIAHPANFPSPTPSTGVRLRPPR
jgi:hypothetical protein